MKPSLAFLLITIIKAKGSSGTSGKRLAKKGGNPIPPKRQPNCVIERSHFDGARMAHIYENHFSWRKSTSTTTRIQVAEPWHVSVAAKLDGERYIIDYVTLGEKHSIHSYVGDTSWDMLNDETAFRTNEILRWFISPQDLPIATKIEGMSLTTGSCEEAIIEWGKNLIDELEGERLVASKAYTEKYNVTALREMMASDPQEAALLVIAWVVQYDFQGMPNKDDMWSESCDMKHDSGVVEGEVYWSAVRDHAMIAIIIFHFEREKLNIRCQGSSINWMREETKRLTQGKKEAFENRDLKNLAPNWFTYAIKHPKAFIIAKELNMPRV